MVPLDKQVSILLFKKYFLLTEKVGQQGQVERVNSTVKRLTTAGILTALEEKTGEGANFQELMSAGTRWVACMKEKVEVYNNTPKYLTGHTPREIHFPEVTFFKKGKNLLTFQFRELENSTNTLWWTNTILISWRKQELRKRKRG